MLRRASIILSLLALGCGSSADDTTNPTLSAGDTIVTPGDTRSDTGTPGPGADVSGPDGDVADCQPDQCAIEGECVDTDATPEGNACQVCDPTNDPVGWSDATGACDDGDACTQGDACVLGACVGAPLACGDGNTCTEDGCTAGACTHSARSGPCDDGDECTVKDACANTVCKGGAPKCDDGNSCTADSCADGVCTHSALDQTPCEDGNPCTTGTVCAAGLCTGGTASPCDDGNYCTADACMPGGPLGAPGAGCVHTSVAAYCADSNPCTDDACDPNKGCVYGLNTAPCNDGNLCTADDACTDGACRGTPADPSDGNPCTNDACDPLLGPSHTNNDYPCDDGNQCTVGDLCSAGACEAGLNSLPCDDGNPCTDDACAPELGCVATPNTATCDDGSVCTEDDVCSQGACVGHTITCDDGNTCTTDSCNATTGCVFDLVVSNACRPYITIVYPPRGATLQGTNKTINVTGSVTSGAGPVETFTINGDPVTLAPDGSFSHPVATEVGGNTLIIDALDELGGSRHRVQAFHWSTDYALPDNKAQRTGMAPQGLAIWLSSTALNKLTEVFQSIVASIKIGDSIPSPALSQSGYKIYINNLTHAVPTVTMKPVNGGIELTVTVNTIKADIDAKGQEWYTPSFSGTLSVATLSATAQVQLSVNPTTHSLVATVGTVAVNMSNPSIQISGVLGWLISPLVNLIVPTFKSDIEKSFADTLKDVIGPLVTDALNGLALEFAFDLPSLAPGAPPVNVEVITDFQSVDFTPAGGALILRGGAYTASKKTPYTNLGAVIRNQCGAPGFALTPPKSSPLELLLGDDLINEILFSAWRGGFLEFDVPPALLAGVDVSQYGITNLDVTVSAMLAPVVSDCATGKPTVHIGDLTINAGLELFGQPMNVVMHVSLLTEIQFSATNGELSFGLAEIESVESDISVQQENLVASEGAVATLVNEQLLPALLGGLAGGSLGSFPLPELDFSGVKIAIAPTSVTRGPGQTVVSGNLQ